MSDIISRLRTLAGITSAYPDRGPTTEGDLDLWSDDDEDGTLGPPDQVKLWKELRDLIGPAVAKAQKLSSKQGKGGSSGASNKKMLADFVRASEEILKWTKG